MMSAVRLSSFFFFNDTATTEIYTLSLHDALPISIGGSKQSGFFKLVIRALRDATERMDDYEDDPSYDKERQLLMVLRSEEHTSELQSRQYLVCRLLLEKKKKKPALTYSLFSLSEY